MNKIAYQLKAALVDLLDQLQGIGIHQPGEDEGQWAGTEGLSFRKAHEALTAANREIPSVDDGKDILASSVWAYRKHPGRRYVVLGVANVAHKHPDHPPEVIYRSLDNLGRLWTRSVPSFREEFAPLGESLPASAGWKAGDGDWNESQDVYSSGIDIGKWSSQIECHGSDQREAEQLRDLVLTSLRSAERAIVINVAPWSSNDAVRLLTLPDGTTCNVFPPEKSDEMDIGEMDTFVSRLADEVSARAGLTKSVTNPEATGSGAN